MFNPQIIDLSLVALEFMQFEGKDEMVAKLSEFSQMQKQMQQMQAAMQQQQAAMQAQTGAQQVQNGQNLVAIPKNALGGAVNGTLG